VFALYRWHVSQKQKDVEILRLMIGTIRKDEFYGFIRDLDYDRPWYDEKFHNGPKELEVDKVLIEYSYLCHLRMARMISAKTFAFFQYDINVILSNGQIKDYFYNLYHCTCKRGIPFPFKHLLDYSFKENFFDKQVFEDPDAWRNEGNHLHGYYLSLNRSNTGIED
jgi:hypothetical protein